MVLRELKLNVDVPDVPFGNRKCYVFLYWRNFATIHGFHSGQTQKPTSHPLVSALKSVSVQSVYGAKFVRKLC